MYIYPGIDTTILNGPTHIRKAIIPSNHFTICLLDLSPHTRNKIVININHYCAILLTIRQVKL